MDQHAAQFSNAAPARLPRTLSGLPVNGASRPVQQRDDGQDARRTARQDACPTLLGLFSLLRRGFLAACFLAVLASPAARGVVVFTTLNSFGQPPYGTQPGALVQGSDGNFYGTTTTGVGINYYHGTVFEITPSGALTSLHVFTGGNDGGFPFAALVQGSDGNFYGTTSVGGANGYGTVFKFIITPLAPPVFTAVTRTGGTLKLTWSAQAGQIYQLQYNSDLRSTNWANLGATITASRPAVTTTDSPSDAQRFYRVVLLNQ